MQIKKAKEYFELGAITGFHAVRDPVQPGNWILSITGKEHRDWTLQTAKNETKSFSSMDSLIKEVERIAGRVSSLKITP